MQKQIDKDLPRTFVNRLEEIMDDESRSEFLSSLRRLLMAYSVRNPKVSYCQSMNYVGALLLFHMPEERAFWVMAVIVEDIARDYYIPQLTGSVFI